MKPVKGKVCTSARIGDILLIKDEHLHRGSWKIAKIMSLISSEVDGVPRAAKLRIPP